jgi:hypothetical protein
MRKFAIAALLLCALLVVPAAASARPHHHVKLKGCPKGKHHPRKPGGHHGRYRVCVPVKRHGQGGIGNPVGPVGPEPPVPTPETAYDNIASSTENPVSLGYEATGTSEFGSQIALGGIDPPTFNPEVQIQLSSWACETGDWFAGCESITDHTFPAPITLNVYAVGPENSVGALLLSKTDTFPVPFRPSADPSCPEATQYRNIHGVCRNGFPNIIVYHLDGFAMPRRAILSVAYNTRDYGSDPLGVSSPMDALNVGLEGPPEKGTNPTEAVAGVYWASTTFSDGTGVFHYEEDPSEWSIGESQIAARVVATH